MHAENRRQRGKRQRSTTATRLRKEEEKEKDAVRREILPINHDVTNGNTKSVEDSFMDAPVCSAATMTKLDDNHAEAGESFHSALWFSSSPPRDTVGIYNMD